MKEDHMSSRELAPSAGIALEEDETAWLIEEVWSGYVHYVHRDYNALKFFAEARRLKDQLGRGRKQHLITKDVSEAMRFTKKADAEAWLANQGKWMQGGQYEVREHMWPLTSSAKQTVSASSRDALDLILSDEAAERGARVMAKQWNYVWSHLTPKDKKRFTTAFKVAFAAAVGGE